MVWKWIPGSSFASESYGRGAVVKRTRDPGGGGGKSMTGVEGPNG